MAQYYFRKFLFLFRLRLPRLKQQVFTYPATSLRKLDRFDIFLNFSSELLVLFLVILVAGFTVFKTNNSSSSADQSLASRFLSYHTALNPELYNHSTSIKTLVTEKSGFIPEAFADQTNTAFAFDQNNQVNPGDANSIISNNSLEAKNPDSLSALMAKQIKVYRTEEFDTLGSIGRKFGISIDTIKWANNLPNNTIKPGWDLIILPTNGLLIKAGPNTTIPDIANKYNGNQERIVSYNGLESPEAIDNGDYIICPDCVIQLPKPPVASKTSKKQYGIDDNLIPVKSGGSKSHTFPKGYCTFYVATRTYVPWGGNAKNWLANAKAYGYVTGTEPASRSIVVTTDSKRYGHVAYVEKVSGNQILVSEMNYEGFNTINQRWININSSTIRGYIYP